MIANNMNILLASLFCLLMVPQLISAQDITASQEQNKKATDKAIELASSARSDTNKQPVLSIGKDVPSLMYQTNDIDKLVRALSAFEKGTSAEEFTLPSLSLDILGTQEPEVINYPEYRLGSISYRSLNNWTIWVNGEKITPHTTGNELRVISVSRDHVHFEWEPELKKMIQRSELNSQIIVDSSSNHRAARTRLHIDKEMGKARFYLYPNQRILTESFVVLEGSERAIISNSSLLPATQDHTQTEAEGAEKVVRDKQTIPQTPSSSEAQSRKSTVDTLLENFSQIENITEDVLSGQ